MGNRSGGSFSVMLPSYEPDDRLIEAIRSVLVQAPSDDSMEIVVIDDCSRNVDVAALVRFADPSGRVRIMRNAQRLGLAGNWNRAVQSAAGRLVHVLHQDDLVLPGFYSRIARAFEQMPRIGMAFCRSRIIDGAGRWLKTASRLRWTAGVLDGWPETIGERQRVQTPAVVVARAAYEVVGPYRSDLCHTLDWEMWVRIATRMPVWYEPRVLAAYRRHAENESTRLFTKGAVWPDIVRAIRLNAERFAEPGREEIVRRSARWHLGSMIRTAVRLIRDGHVADAHATLVPLPDMLALLASQDDARVIERRLMQLDLAIESISAAA